MFLSFENSSGRLGMDDLVSVDSNSFQNAVVDDLKSRKRCFMTASKNRGIS